MVRSFVGIPAAATSSKISCVSATTFASSVGFPRTSSKLACSVKLVVLMGAAVVGGVIPASTAKFVKWVCEECMHAYVSREIRTSCECCSSGGDCGLQR